MSAQPKEGADRYELVIPETAPSPNCYVRAHWRVYHGIKTKWHWLILEALQPHGRPQAALQRARVTIVRYGLKKLDRDNLYGSCKPVIDALKANNLIADDDDEHLDLQVRQAERPKGAMPCTMIEIMAV